MLIDLQKYQEPLKSAENSLLDASLVDEIFYQVTNETLYRV